MRVGAFLFGGVEMDDAGAGPPAPTDRRHSNEVMWRASEQMLDVGVLCDRLGYDSYWLTEHHFQYEGYEVVPNGLLFGAILAERSGYPVVPVAHDSGDYWPRNSFLKWPGTIRLVIGPPIDTTGLGAHEINARAEAWIESTMARLRGAAAEADAA